MNRRISVFLRQQRHKAVIPYLIGDVLDLGCGPARILTWIRPDQIYVGVENDPFFLTWLEKNRPEREFHNLDLDKHPLELNQRFDTVLLLAVVEHLHSPKKVLKQVPRWLKPNGKLVLTTPTPLGERVRRLGAHARLFPDKAFHDHITIFTRDTLQPVLESCGLKIDSYRKFLLGGNQLFICSVGDG